MRVQRFLFQRKFFESLSDVVLYVLVRTPTYIDIRCLRRKVFETAQHDSEARSKDCGMKILNESLGCIRRFL